MSRTYKWETENQEDQITFLGALVRLFRTFSGSKARLYLDGLPDFVVSAGKVTSKFDNFVNCYLIFSSRGIRPYALSAITTTKYCGFS